jgi:hypothetical protein
VSNCIEITNRAVKVFNNRDIDVNALRALVASVCDLPDAPKSGDGYIAWWFLSTADFDSAGNVSVVFGQGRSSHTWRDFRGTLGVLAKFARRSIRLTFTLRDIDWDNNSRPGPFTITLEPGGNVLGF